MCLCYNNKASDPDSPVDIRVNVCNYSITCSQCGCRKAMITSAGCLCVSRLSVLHRPSEKLDGTSCRGLLWGGSRGCAGIQRLRLFWSRRSDGSGAEASAGKEQRGTRLGTMRRMPSGAVQRANWHLGRRLASRARH